MIVEVLCVDELTREELISIILELRERVEALEKENTELRAKLGMGGGSKPSTPEWVKPNRAERRAAERAERKKRKQSFARKRDKATLEVRHAVEKCPDCGRTLSGGWIVSKRQTIEIPQTPTEITDHVLIARRCGVCGKVHIPKLGIADGVIGKQRVGPRLMSLIATLAIAKRMPQRSIQRLLEGLYGVHISLGEITEILHKVAAFAGEMVRWILRRIRGSPVAHGDETPMARRRHQWLSVEPVHRHVEILPLRQVPRGGCCEGNAGYLLWWSACLRFLCGLQLL